MFTSFDYTSETTRTWVRYLKSYEEIPKEFRPAFPKYEDQFPYTLLIPEDRASLFRKRNKKVMCVYEDHFALLQVLRNRIKRVSTKFADVLYLERGKVLLYSWLKIATPSGTLFINFNTTTECLFDPVIAKIRQGMSASTPDDVALGENEQELSKFDYLRTVNFKYMNYGRKSIRPNDAVIGIVYQPEQCIQEFRLFNTTLFRRYATGHLSILTEKELILIKEDKRVKTDQEGRYGGVFTYIPRRQIHNVSFISDPKNSHCVMEVTLPENTHLTSEFSSANEELKLLQDFLE